MSIKPLTTVHKANVSKISPYYYELPKIDSEMDFICVEILATSRSTFIYLPIYEHDQITDSPLDMVKIRINKIALEVDYLQSERRGAVNVYTFRAGDFANEKPIPGRLEYRATLKGRNKYYLLRPMAIGESEEALSLLSTNFCNNIATIHGVIHPTEEGGPLKIVTDWLPIHLEIIREIQNDKKSILLLHVIHGILNAIIELYKRGFVYEHLELFDIRYDSANGNIKILKLPLWRETKEIDLNVFYEILRQLPLDDNLILEIKSSASVYIVMKQLSRRLKQFNPIQLFTHSIEIPEIPQPYCNCAKCS